MVKGWGVLEAAASPHDKSTAHLPLIHLLRSCLDIELGSTRHAIERKLSIHTTASHEALRPVLSALCSLLGAEPEDVEWQQLDPAMRRRRIMNAIKTVLLWRAAAGPLLLVLEDLHWIDGETQATLDELVDSLGAAQLLLLVTYRPEYRHVWASKSYYSHIRVDPLAATSADAFLRALVGDDASLARLTRLLIDRSAARPLFLEEIVRDLVESDVLVGAPGRYRLSRKIEEIAIPRTVQAVLAARIDRLPSEQKNLLQVAGVIGRNVPATLLKAVAELSEEVLREGLAALQSAEFLYQTRLIPAAEYSFKHALTHDVAVETLLLERRRALHARTAHAIEQLYPERLVALSETLAEHFEKGEIWAGAVRCWLQAAGKAKVRYSYEQGLRFCTSALSCAEKTSELVEERRKALVLLGNLQSLTGDLDGANENYERAIALTSDAAQRQSIQNRYHRLGFVVRNGARIAYAEHGHGDDAIFLLIPLCYDTTIFQPVVEELCDEFRIVQIFGRGTGASDPAPWPYRFAEQVNDARVIIEALHGKRSTAVGVSDGGILVVRLAHAFPDLLQRLVLIGTGPGHRNIGTPYETQSTWSQGYIRELDGHDIEALAAQVVHQTISEPETEDLAQALRYQLAMLGPDTWLNFIDPGPDVEIGAILDQVRVPTLAMYGTEDLTIPAEQSRYVANRIAGASVYEFRGKGHLPVFTATSEFCEALRQFLRGGTASPQPSPVARA
jgi:pimeloyl-ACP methyl ester carboxylesterase